ncbi:MAG: phosphoserine phosphatase SerB [Proteobacteria bacterium]|nr:phosphoserine phosphatase SerB [Pseudomonadota bacterium]
MPYVTTLIAPQQAPFFDEGPIKTLKLANIETDIRTVKEENRAVDIFSGAPVPKTVLDSIRHDFKIDAICQNADTRTKRLFMADMDATMVEEETLDELAAHAGLKDKIAEITKRAMNGELDFREAVRERVGLLKGLPLSALSDTAAKITYTKGGHELLKALRVNNVHCVLVSGGFTYFTSKVAENIGFHENHGNILEITGNALAGTVAEPILDKNFKKQCLEAAALAHKINPKETIAIGDGANDLPMLETAGLGIGFQSKKVLRDALPNHLLYNGLDALIFVLGLTRV